MSNSANIIMHMGDHSQNISNVTTCPATYYPNIHQQATYLLDNADCQRIESHEEQQQQTALLGLRAVYSLIPHRFCNCIKLKGYADGKIFIGPDEPLEDRRKRMLKRLKFRAERDGKNVSVENGILLVDNVPVFSLQDGKIASNIDVWKLNAAVDSHIGQISVVALVMLYFEYDFHNK